MPRITALLLLVALAITACNDGGEGTSATTEASVTPTAAASAEPSASGTRWGIAGLVPAGFPDSTAGQWEAFYRTRGLVGGVQGIYAAWTPDLAEGVIPELFVSQSEVGQRFDFETLPLIGWNSEEDGRYIPLLDWDDDEAVARFTSASVAFAREYEPRHLGIGNEINRLFEEDPVAYAAFVARLPAIANAIRDASPGTRVFTVFQYEYLLGEAFLSGRADLREPEFQLVDEVADALDLVAFTTYPYFDYETPEAIPDDYYVLGDRIEADISIAFTEVGWPAEPLAPAPNSPHGGSVEEQAAFVERLEVLLADVEPEFVMWAFEHDVRIAAGAGTFDSIGLATRAGIRRPSFAAWQRLAGVE